MSSQNINLEELLIPVRQLDAEHSINISTEDDLIFLGQDNLSSIKQYWSKEQRVVHRVIEDVELDITLLSADNPDGIREVAARHENWASNLFSVLNGEYRTRANSVLGNYRRRLRDRRAALAAREQCSVAYMHYLDELIAKAEPKPPFTFVRVASDYVPGDDVKFLTETSFMSSSQEKSTFISGTVVMVFDGRVLVSTSDDAERLWIAVHDPYMLSDQDFSYLKSHPNYLKVWLHAAKCDSSRSFDSEKFAEILARS